MLRAGAAVLAAASEYAETDRANIAAMPLLVEYLNNKVMPSTQA